jgi:hypothetical protein
MNGYKVFNPDFTCRDFQYEVGKTYEMELNPDVCNRGFHFCKRAIDCFGYYSFDPANKVAEIIALGAVAEKGDKCATNKIQIVREIPWGELLNLVNTGKENTGHYNSGNNNSGNWNSGHCNSGHYNSGNNNSGNWNSGNNNSGHSNSGNWNQCDFCAGDFNTVDHETGCFCTEEHKIRTFDQETNITFTEWRNSKAYEILCSIQFEPKTWVCANDMTNDEKAAYPEYEVNDGYLRINNTDRVFLSWWESLTDEKKERRQRYSQFQSRKIQIDHRD